MAVSHKDFPGLKGIQLTAALRKALGVKKGKLPELIQEYNRKFFHVNADVVFAAMHDNSTLHAEMHPARPPFLLPLRERPTLTIQSPDTSHRCAKCGRTILPGTPRPLRTYASSNAAAALHAFRQALSKGTASLLALLPDNRTLRLA